MSILSFILSFIHWHNHSFNYSIIHSFIPRLHNQFHIVSVYCAQCALSISQVTTTTIKQSTTSPPSHRLHRRFAITLGPVSSLPPPPPFPSPTYHHPVSNSLYRCSLCSFPFSLHSPLPGVTCVLPTSAHPRPLSVSPLRHASLFPPTSPVSMSLARVPSF